MSITKIMQDPKARAIYATLDFHVPPATIVDDYLQAKLAGKTSLCLALEEHARDMARQYFDKPGVLEALSAVERYKKMRKPGKGAPKILQQIADSIESDYAAGNYEALGDGRIQFTAGNTRIKCKNAPGAVALVVAKYRRGIGSSRAARYGKNTAIV